MNMALQLDGSGRPIKELILSNSLADEFRVSEMHINITKFSAIDSKGIEHYIKDFPGQLAVQLKGMGSGHFIKSSSVVSLEPGSYTTLRYYLDSSNNRFIYSDGVEEAAIDLDFLDFKIENGLTIDGGEAAEVKLWFDFTPYQFSRHFKPLKDWYASWRDGKRQFATS
jgi:hypothetical protein